MQIKKFCGLARFALYIKAYLNYIKLKEYFNIPIKNEHNKLNLLQKLLCNKALLKPKSTLHT